MQRQRWIFPAQAWAVRSTLHFHPTGKGSHGLAVASKTVNAEPGFLMQKVKVLRGPGAGLPPAPQPDHDGPAPCMGTSTQSPSSLHTQAAGAVTSPLLSFPFSSQSCVCFSAFCLETQLQTQAKPGEGCCLKAAR